MSTSRRIPVLHVEDASKDRLQGHRNHAAQTLAILRASPHLFTPQLVLTAPGHGASVFGRLLATALERCVGNEGRIGFKASGRR